MISDIGGLTNPLKHTSLLEELLFWTVKFEFPQKIVTFLLSILPDDDYKVSHISNMFRPLYLADFRIFCKSIDLVLGTYFFIALEPEFFC